MTSESILNGSDRAPDYWRVARIREFLERPGIRTGLALGLLLSAWLVTFWGLLFDGARRDPRFDAARFFIPSAYYLDHHLREGVFPLWNPLNFCGTPFAANPQAAVFYPPNLVRSLLTSDPTPYRAMYGFGLLTGFQFLLAGAAAFALARRHGLSRSSSAIAAIYFTLNALMIRRLAEFHFVSALCWVPLVLIFLEKSLHLVAARRKRVAFAIAAGTFLALSILSGFLQITPYIAFLVAVWGLTCAVIRNRRLGDVEIPHSVAKCTGAWISTSVVLFLVAGSLSAAMLIPTAEFASVSGRVVDPEKAVGTYTPHFTWSYVLESMSVYPGERFQVETIRGAGIAFIALIAASLFSRNQFKWCCWTTVLVLIDCTIGPPMPIASLIKYLTPFEMVASSRAFDVALLPLSILAGHGFEALIKSGSGIRETALRGAVAAVSIIGLIYLCSILSAGSFVSVSGSVVVYPLLFAVLAVVVPSHARGYLWKGALLLLVIGEVGTWSRAYFDQLTITGPVSLPPPNREQPPVFWRSNFRGTDGAPNANMNRLAPAMNGYDALFIDDARDIISGAYRGAGYRRRIRSSEMGEDNLRTHLYLKRRFWLAARYSDAQIPPKNTLFAPTTIAFLEKGHSLAIPYIEQVEVGSGVSSNVTVLTQAQPKNHPYVSDGINPSVRTVDIPEFSLFGKHAVLRVNYRSNCFGTIHASFANPVTGAFEWGFKYPTLNTGKEGAIVEFPLPDFERVQAKLYLQRENDRGDFGVYSIEVVQDNADENDLIEIVASGPNVVRVKVGHLSGPRILSFLDADYAGWQAIVDGEAAPVLRSFGAFKAVYLPAGPHEVEFRFRSRTVLWGIGISLGSCAVTIALFAWLTWGFGQNRIGREEHARENS